MAPTTTNDVSPSSTPSLSQLRLLILEPSPRRISNSTPSAPLPPSSQPKLHISTAKRRQSSLISPLLQALTGELPPPLENGEGEEGRSFAGYTSHPPLRVRTKYFDRRVGIWCDEVPLSASGGAEGRTGRKGSGSNARKEMKEVSGFGGVLGDDEKEHREYWGGGFNGKGDGDGDEATNFSALRSEHDHQSDGFKGKDTEEEEKEDLHSTADEVIYNPEDAITTHTWLTQMLSPQAHEVRHAIGAIILTLPLPDALEPNRDVSSRSAPFNTLPDLAPSDSGSDEPRTLQYQYKLKHEYLTLISAVNSLRSIIEEERAEGAAEGGDVAAVIILQGFLSHSPSSKSLNVKSIPRRQEPTSHDAVAEDASANQDEDVLLEAIEEQLLATIQDTGIAETPILGWDVVIWDGVVTTTTTMAKAPTTKPTAQTTSARLDKDKDKRNIYGEKVGLPRLLEVIEAVDWTAPPFQVQPPGIGPDPSLTPSSDEDGDGESDLLGEEEEDEAMQVEQLQSLLSRAMAVRDAGSGMSRAERERLARRLFLGGRRDH